MRALRSSTYFTACSTFLLSLSSSQFLCSVWKARFFAPAHMYREPARTGAVKIGRRSTLATVSAAARPYLYGVEHAGMLVGVGMMFEGSPLSGHEARSYRNLVFGGSQTARPDPNHDASMRIGGEAPRWWTHS